MGVSAPRSIELSINELVLYGFPPGDRDLIAIAVAQELTCPFINQDKPGIFEKSCYIEVIDSGHFTVSSGDKAKNIGTQVAQAVLKGISK